MKTTYTNQFTTILPSQPGATSLETVSPSEVNGHGVSLQPWEILSEVEHTTLSNQNKGEMNMMYTIGEHIEYKYGYYMTIGIKECAVCTVPFPDICDEDPGSVEAAVGVRYVCEHPECRKITGAATLICGAEIEELLEKERNEIYMLAQDNDGVLECDGEDVDLWAIIARRDAVDEYLQEFQLAWETEYYAHYEEEEDDWDSDNEKWSNYWSDYSQCGIRVSY